MGWPWRPATRGELIVLDHHVSNTLLRLDQCGRPEAAATAVVVRRLAHRPRLAAEPRRRVVHLHRRWSPTPVGSSTRTPLPTFSGWPRSYRRSTSRLPRSPASCSRSTGSRICSWWPRVSRAPRSTPSLAFVASWITADDLEQFGVEIEETEGMIDLVRRAAEAEVACILKETPEGIRVSLRSLSKVDVAALAGSIRRRRAPLRGGLHRAGHRRERAGRDQGRGA